MGTIGVVLQVTNKKEAGQRRRSDERLDEKLDDTYIGHNHLLVGVMAIECTCFGIS
jgi:hypothetical protein